MKKSISVWSDLHLGHLNSIKFDSRPFTDLDHMHRVIINNYNAQVDENGLCYFLGDVGLSNTTLVKEIIGKMNGTKVLILGNHDKGHNAMYDIGFDVVLNSATVWIAGERVTMSHCPLPGLFREDVTGMRNCQPGDNWHGEGRHKEFSVTDEGQFHLHGHIHSNPTNGKLKIDGRQFDVGCPANNYRPVSFGTIESWIARTKQGQNMNGGF